MSQGVGRFGFLSGLFRIGGNPDESLSSKRILGGIGLISLIAGGVFLYLRWSKTPALPQITYQTEEEKKHHVEELAKSEFHQKLPPHSPSLDRRNLVVVDDAPENRPGHKDEEIHSGENLKAPHNNASLPLPSPFKFPIEPGIQRVFENEGEDKEQQVKLVVDKTERSNPSPHHSPPLDRKPLTLAVTSPLESIIQHKDNRGATEIDSDEELK
ncbi:MAG: hypothetical protein KDK56_03320, partial [Simkania sp.]|nr:hypothetical protein [Simkania sp.]